MLVTIPVTISTMPRTQKRPVQEVKSTCQQGGSTCQSTALLAGTPGHCRGDTGSHCVDAHVTGSALISKGKPCYRGVRPCQGCSSVTPRGHRDAATPQGTPWPYLSLEAEDSDRNGHYSSDDHGNDDGFGLIHTEESQDDE